MGSAGVRGTAGALVVARAAAGATLAGPVASTAGCPDGTFRPGATVTRQAAAALLHRTLPLR
jgi:hypothetical protein